jgi:O-antigen/teichoic acid export membrane protein
MLLQHSFFYLVARGAPGIINFIAITVYTRFLSQADYGWYAQIIAGVALINSFVFQWMGLGIIRYLPSYQKDKEKMFLAAVLAGFIVMVSATAILGGIAYFLNDSVEIRWMFLIGVFLLWLQAWFDLNLELARSKLSPLKYGLANLMKVILSVGVGGAFAYLGFGIWGLMIGMLCGLFVPVAWMTRAEWKGIRIGWGKGEFALLRMLFIYGFPSTIAFSLEFAINAFNRWFLAYEQGQSQAGIFAVGYDLTKQSLGLFMYIVGLASSPILMRSLENGGMKSVQVELEKVFYLLVGIGLPGMIGIGMLSVNITNTLLGPDFRHAVAVIPGTAIATFLLGLKEYYINRVFQIENQTIRLIWPTIFGALLYIPLGIYSISRWGMIGSVYATIFIYGFSITLSLFLIKNKSFIKVNSSKLCKIIICALLMGVAVWPMIHFRGIIALFVQVAWGGLIYFIFLDLLQVVPIRRRLRMMFMKKYVVKES